MKGPYGNPDAVLNEIGGQFVQGRDKIVPPQKIAHVCRLFWPIKTAIIVGDFAKQTDRTANVTTKAKRKQRAKEGHVEKKYDMRSRVIGVAIAGGGKALAA